MSGAPRPLENVSTPRGSKPPGCEPSPSPTEQDFSTVRQLLYLANSGDSGVPPRRRGALRVSLERCSDPCSNVLTGASLLDLDSAC